MLSMFLSSLLKLVRLNPELSIYITHDFLLHNTRHLHNVHLYYLCATRLQI